MQGLRAWIARCAGLLALILVAVACTPNSAEVPSDDSQTDAGSIELLFSDPVGSAGPIDRCEAETCTRLLELIGGAQTTIDFAVYGMRNQTELLEALEAAQARGVTVRGVVDRDREGQNYYTSTDLWVSRLGNVRDDLQAERDLDANLGEQQPFEPPCERPTGFDGPLQCLAYDLGDRWLVAAHASRENFVDPDGEGGPNRIMHDKFFIVDDRWVWTGSSNISDSGTGGYNANIVALVDSPQLAAVYAGEFEQMWSGRFHTLKEGDGIEHLDVDETEVAVWFSPQDDAMRFGVEALIAQAGDRIDIAVFYLTNKYVTADLIAAHRRGVEVRVIVDATSAKNGYSKHELLREAGIPVKVENWGGKMHMKAAAIDGSTVIVGSMNWTRAGEDTNDENTLFLGSSVLAAEFETFFDHLWDSIPEEWGQFGTRPDPESAASSSACMDGVDNDFDGLADGDDPGCGEDPPPLQALPPHWILEKSQGEPSGGYRLYEGSTCDPSYPDPGVCIPPISRGDLDCPDIPYRSFTVLDPDPHGFDRAGDGLGCES